MKFLPLLWGSLKRRKARTTFTVLSIVFSFLLFGFLMAIRQAFRMGVDVSGADRLLSIHKVSLIQPLPISYLDRIAQVPGVKLVTHSTWFGGIYQDPKNFFGQMAVDPETFLTVYPEFILKPAERQAWLADRQGAIVGIATAKRFGWKVGDKIPLQATYMRKRDGSLGWEFNLDGIFTGAEKGTDTSNFYFHYDYLKEAGPDRGTVGWFIERIADPKSATAVGKTIDERFANSPAETKTSTEQAFAQGFANQVGDIGELITAIVSAAFFIILLVVGNTIAQSVRERTSELAVLKTLGFTNRQVLVLVLAESLLLAVVAGGFGLLIAWTIITVTGDPTHGFLPVFYLPEYGLVLGAVIAVLLGLLAGVLPALQAMRLRIVDALRRV
ncbi:MAG TPA: FtsX-like permease family protein [Thermoanaerobaculia bacterium]|nr:FtsX-like permease family protein [Thermoanaerobaculia bacterium]